MSSEGIFEIENADIVRLDKDSDCDERSGWVNVGPHALFIELTSAGDLVVEAYARTHELQALASLTVQASKAKAAGGVDPESESNDEEVGPAEP